MWPFCNAAVLTKIVLLVAAETTEATFGVHALLQIAAKAGPHFSLLNNIQPSRLERVMSLQSTTNRQWLIRIEPKSAADPMNVASAASAVSVVTSS